MNTSVNKMNRYEFIIMILYIRNMLKIVVRCCYYFTYHVFDVACRWIRTMINYTQFKKYASLQNKNILIIQSFIYLFLIKCYCH